ncbi:hypothetical protein [Kutzneria sp. NPDC051319]|uniref:hypothetical protein n=1 Tax=Kutzneria sp. NPDC051319 TaxID=3155047 RepID=UPI003441676A
MVNTALARLLKTAELSNAGLARSIVGAGAREGIHLGTNATAVARMLQGCQPRWPVPRLVASVLATRLGYAVEVNDCGFTENVDAADTFDGMRCFPTVDGTIGVVSELSGRDIGRRNFLMGSAFAAAAFAEPALLALTVPPAAVAAQTGGPRVGASDVQMVLETIRHFGAQHRRYGGAGIHAQVAHFVHEQAERARRAAYTELVGRDLFAALAQATHLASLTAVDSGRHALAQRYNTQALNLALHAGDRLYAANGLSEMSRNTTDIANASPIETERVRNGQHAAALAKSALEVAGTTTPALTSYLHAIEARAFAVLGDRQSTQRAVDDAQRAFERTGGEEPAWFGFYGEADLMADVGQCLRDIGRPRQGLALLERSVQALPAARVTAKAKTKVHIAAAYLELREYDQAAAVAEQAVTDVGCLASQRSRDRVQALQQRVRRHDSRNLSEMDDRLTEFLGEPTGM